MRETTAKTKSEIDYTVDDWNLWIYGYQGDVSKLFESPHWPKSITPDSILLSDNRALSIPLYLYPLEDAQRLSVRAACAMLNMLRERNLGYVARFANHYEVTTWITTPGGSPCISNTHSLRWTEMIARLTGAEVEPEPEEVAGTLDESVKIEQIFIEHNKRMRQELVRFDNTLGGQ